MRKNFKMKNKKNDLFFNVILEQMFNEVFYAK